MQLNYQYRKFYESVSMAKDLIINNKKLNDENTQKDDKIKNIQDELEQYKKDLVKANESLASSTDKIGTLTQERNEFKDKAESLERKHESDWMLYLTVAVVSYFGGIATDRTILPKIKDFIMSWGAKHGINTEDYANLFSSVNRDKGVV